MKIFQLNTQTQSTYRDVDLWMRESPKKKIEKRFSFSLFHPLGGIIVKGREIARVKKNLKRPSHRRGILVRPAQHENEKKRKKNENFKLNESKRTSATSTNPEMMIYTIPKMKKETQERKGDVIRNSFTNHEIDKNQKYLQVIPRHNTRHSLTVSPYYI